MKKLLMLGAILALGATTMAVDPTTEKANAEVRLQAEIVSKNLEVTGLDGKDILLDFGTINKKNNVDVSRIATAEYKVTYTGDNKMSTNTLDILLVDATPELTHTTNSLAGPLVANLTMEDNRGTGFGVRGEGLGAEGISLDDIEAKGEVYRGKIVGQLTNISTNTTDGFYAGNTYLNVTLTGTAGEAIGSN